MTFVTEGSTATSPMDVTNNNANAALNVKASFQDQIRRFAVPAASLPALEARARSLFSIAPETCLELFYRDTDGDLITLSLDEELQHAFQLSQGVLRLEVRVNPAPQGIPSAPFADPVQAPGLEQPAGPFAHFQGAMRPFAMRASMRGGMRGMPFMHGMRGGMMRGHVMEHAQDLGFPPGFEHKLHHLKKWARKNGHCHDDDSESGKLKDKLTVRHVKDVTIPDGTKLAPNTPFVKTWRVRNEGLQWPAGSRLIFISKKGDHMGGPDFVPIEGTVVPGAELDISVNLIAPEELGLYTGVWRMCTAEGKKFGQRLWVSITVTSSSSSEESEDSVDALVVQVQEMGFEVPRRKIERLMKKYAGNQEMVVNALAKKAQWFDSFHDQVHGHHRHHHGHHHRGFGSPFAGRGGAEDGNGAFRGRGGWGSPFAARGAFEGRGGFEGAHGAFRGRGGFGPFGHATDSVE